jgi:hypothetical protein
LAALYGKRAGWRGAQALRGRPVPVDRSTGGAQRGSIRAMPSNLTSLIYCDDVGDDGIISLSAETIFEGSWADAVSRGLTYSADLRPHLYLMTGNDSVPLIEAANPTPTPCLSPSSPPA